MRMPPAALCFPAMLFLSFSRLPASVMPPKPVTGVRFGDRPELSFITYNTQWNQLTPSQQGQVKALLTSTFHYKPWELRTTKLTEDNTAMVTMLSQHGDVVGF